MIEIDGAEGGGGDQILRTSLALSAATGKPCKITNIRKNRPQPGIKAQHLEAARALAALCDAETKGIELHSKEVCFSPGKIKGGHYEIHIPTAGSVALVLQGIMIASVNAKKDISVAINGGATNGRWAPSINYVKNVFLPLLGKMGFEGYVDVKKYGYYPEGGAAVSCNFAPCNLKQVEIMKRGKIISVEGLSHASKSLQKNRVTERQKMSFENSLKGYGTSSVIFDSYFATTCHGSGIDVWIKTEGSFLGVDSLGDREKDAESVGGKTQSGSRECDSDGSQDWQGCGDGGVS